MNRDAGKEIGGTRRRFVALVALVAALVGVAACGTATSQPQSIAQLGGLRVVEQIVCPADAGCASSATQQQERDALLSRARDGLGVAGASVTQTDSTHYQVDLPAYTNMQLATQALAHTGQVYFLDTGGQGYATGVCLDPHEYLIIASGQDVNPQSVRAKTDQMNLPVIIFTMASSSQAEFSNYTAANIGHFLTFTVDGCVVESAVIQSQISGEAQISGFLTITQAEAAAAYLKSQPLPAPVTQVSAQALKPTAG